jgi:YjbE family integral membrane protein
VVNFGPDIAAFLTVVLIDVALAGDNAIVVGMAAAGLPEPQRRPAILMGIAGAALLRIALAGVAVQLLRIVGMAAAGGLLLLWVAWKLWCELRGGRHPTKHGDARTHTKTRAQAILQILVADLSMSLDNVLAVAGAARDNTWVLVAGLAFSVVLMVFAANLVARLIQTHRWIGYVGLTVVLYVALTMIWEGGADVLGHLPAGPS